jgi:hypothetical protein
MHRGAGAREQFPPRRRWLIAIDLHMLVLQQMQTGR